MPKTKTSSLFFATFSILFTLILTIPTLANAQLKVVTTLPDLAAIAHEVGGTDITVTSLARATEDPHYVDPRPNFIVTLSRADLLIINGRQLETGWMPQLLTSARNAKIQPGAPGYLDASTAVPTALDVPTGKVDRSRGDIHAGGNPHFTTDPRAAAQIAHAIRDKLMLLDPDHAPAYKTRCASFTTKIQTFATHQRQRFANLPPASRRLITYHRAWPYFISWLNLDTVGEIEAKPGVPPTPARTAQVLKLLKSSSVHLILQANHYPRKTSDTLARLSGAHVVVGPMQTHFHDGESYLDHMKVLTDQVYNALSK